MEIACAQCGCLVERGVIVRPCKRHPGCCCSALPIRRTREPFATTDTGRLFTATVVEDSRGRVLVPVPFAPDEVWGPKSHHHVAGTVDDMGVRGVLEIFSGGFALLLGPSWRSECGIGAGDEVGVVLAPEGPQRGDLPEDFGVALDADRQAAEFWDSLAQFYRRAYLLWIDGTKRRPNARPERIATVIGLLRDGVKQRPAE